MNSSSLETVASCIGEACQTLLNPLSDRGVCTLSYFGTTDWSKYNGANSFTQDDCVWFTLNPISFLFNDSLLRYSDLHMCCDVSKSLLRPFCVSLLPYCVFYTWIRFFIALFNEVYVYPLRIKMKVETLKQKVTKLFKKEIDDFTWVLRLSSIIEIVNAVISLWFFKGLQFYASQLYPYNYYTIPSNEPGCKNLGSLSKPDCISMEDGLCLYNSDNYVLKVAAIFWFIAELTTLTVQMFAVSCLANIHTFRIEGKSFYKKNRNWALFWASIFLVTGGTALGFNLFTEEFKDLKMYYKFYSHATLSYWFIYSITLVLLLTDRYLTFESKQKPRSKSKWYESKRPLSNLDETVNAEGITLELGQKSIAKKEGIDDEEEEEKMSAPTDKNSLQQRLQASEIAEDVKRIYLEELDNHLKEIREMGAGFDQQEDYKASTSYIGYMITFHCVNAVGYLLMLIPYQLDNSVMDQSYFGTQLTFHLIGFIIASLSIIAYELSHSYLLYKSFFDPMVQYWKNQSTS